MYSRHSTGFLASSRLNQTRRAVGVPWVSAYGISDNTRAFWSLGSARHQLGYRPQDDSEVVFAAGVRRLLMSGAAGETGLPGLSA